MKLISKSQNSLLFLRGLGNLIIFLALMPIINMVNKEILINQNLKLEDASIQGQAVIFLLEHAAGALFWSGIYDISHDIFVRLCRKTSYPDKYYQRAQRFRRILNYGFQVYFTWRLFTDYGNSWITMPDDASAFSLSFSKPYMQYGRFLNFLDRPFVIPIFTTFFFSAVVYNFKELVCNIGSEQKRQGDSPFFGFLNAMAFMVMSTRMFFIFQRGLVTHASITSGMTQKQMRQAELRALKDNPMTLLLGVFLKYWATTSDYQFFQNFVLLIVNTVYTFLPKPIIEIEDDLAQQSRAPIRRRRPRRSRRRYGEYQSAVFHVPEPQAAESSVVSEAEVPDEPAGTREKVKTRGTPGPGRSDDRQVVHAKIDALPEVQYNVGSKIRKQKTGEINSLRRCSQVKTHLINKELTTLVKFLPNAKIENITGSEHALTWAWNRKKYRLKFEKPHGTHSEYQGRKLKKILNVLEAGYLWGWGHDNIQRYIKANDSSRHLGTIIAAILFGRPPLEDVSVAPRASM